ncbi:protein translocase subunit SecD [bacterium]|nr:protein translocase subunit SecD [bacterium]
MEAGVPKFALSRFILWIVAAIVAGYFFVSCDYNKFLDSNLSIKDRILTAFTLPRIDLGIDLQGGTRLVLSVDLEKAVENRLTLAGKTLERTLKKADGRPTPSKREIKSDHLLFTFKNEDVSRRAGEVLREQFKDFEIKRTDRQVEVRISNAEAIRIKAGSVEQAVNVLRTRMDNFQVRGMTVSPHGARNIVIQLPGIENSDEIKSTIMKAAILEFKIVEKSGYDKDALLDEFDGELPSDKMLVPGKRSAGDAEDMWYLVSAFPDLTGDQIADARMTYDERHHPAVGFTLTSDGAKEFRELTSGNIGRNLGIVMDGKMISAPNINSEIGGHGQIAGHFTMHEAVRLSSLLRAGALRAPLKFEQESRVGSSLGRDSIQKGLFACLLAFLLLFLFSLFYYGLVGLFAFCALTYNVFMILAFLSYFRATLTLPGIAGMVLTIGMAVDASILIFERIREELANGASYRKAIKSGFGGAMMVIFDANITTMLTGIILFKFGGPAIRGFAVTLMMGIVATVLSGVFFMRSIFDFILDHTKIEKLRF